MLAVFERRFRQLEVRPDRRDNRHGVDVRRAQYLAEVRRQVYGRISFLRTLQRRGTPIADRYELAALERIEVPDDIRTPIAEANHTNANRLRAGGGSAFLER